MLSNGTTANAVHHDLDLYVHDLDRYFHDLHLYFQDHTFSNVTISKKVKKLSGMASIEVDIFHQMGPLGVLYFVILT